MDATTYELRTYTLKPGTQPEYLRANREMGRGGPHTPDLFRHARDNAELTRAGLADLGC